MLALKYMLRTSPSHFRTASVAVTIAITIAITMAIAIAGTMIRTGCSMEPAKIEVRRPVRVLVVSSSNVGIHAQFPGEIRARVESRLPFRAPAKITARKVVRGAVLDQKLLAWKAAQANVDAAQAIYIGQLNQQFASTTATPSIRVPLTALLHENATMSVWVVENGAVRLVPVQIGDTSEPDRAQEYGGAERCAGQPG